MIGLGLVEGEREGLEVDKWECHNVKEAIQNA